MSSSEHQWVLKNESIRWVHFIGSDASQIRVALHSFNIKLDLDPYYFSTVTKTSTFFLHDAGDYVVRVAIWRNLGYDGEIEPLQLIVTPNTVVSWSQSSHETLLKDVQQRLKELDNPDDITTHRIISLLLEGILDKAFEVLNGINDELEYLEQQVVLSHSRLSNNQVTMDNISRLHRTVLEFRHIVASHRDVAYHLARHWMKKNAMSASHAFVIYDHSIRLYDSVDGTRDLIHSVMDIYLSAASNRVNEIVQKLTVMAAIFLPASLIAALYGMNFRFLPGVHWYFGFYAVVGGIILLSGALLWAFRRNGWI